MNLQLKNNTFLTRNRKNRFWGEKIFIKQLNFQPMKLMFYKVVQRWIKYTGGWTQTGQIDEFWELLPLSTWRCCFW